MKRQGRTTWQRHFLIISWFAVTAFGAQTGDRVDEPSVSTDGQVSCFLFFISPVSHFPNLNGQLPLQSTQNEEVSF